MKINAMELKKVEAMLEKFSAGHLQSIDLKDSNNAACACFGNCYGACSYNCTSICRSSSK